MARPPEQSSADPRLSVAVVARRLGVAPTTLRSWDRRYGLGPSDRRPGQHRSYTSEDVARLEAVRLLLLEGATVAEAVRLTRSATDTPHGAEVGADAPTAVLPRPSPPSWPARLRRLHASTRQMDADRVVAVLDQAVDAHGVTATWDHLLRPALAALGEQWRSDERCIAEEHLLSECATRLFHQLVGARPVTARRPVLLLSASAEGHVLPLHALAAALAEQGAPSRLLGSTPTAAALAAIRRIHPSAVVIWAQASENATIDVFTRLPRIRGGLQTLAAGPGWSTVPVPPGVARANSLQTSLDLLGDTARGRRAPARRGASPLRPVPPAPRPGRPAPPGDDRSPE
ncbi:B12 binding domain-containing protein [Geodermatophilus telluris]|uniref:B12 binding domain-containing protein n=1 Tax=Geodermatophilus telluris TaxID=1190417 RepID=A0A1G6THS1_9ACTN|nr:MerR family transcriptional regulator [Geodermatophilus telluris]SDD28712.1 B12 binding domain-containing protein [Geodermatophilus telluris]